MSVKVLFVGNPLAGDDGIGPHLYDELNDHPSLKNFDLVQSGVMGLDIIPSLKEDDRLLIVDAIRSKDGFGEVVLVGEKQISSGFFPISPHDFGAEQTIKMVRALMPDFKEIQIIGVKINLTEEFKDSLSPILQEKLPVIKEKVLESILKATNNSK
ncbi:MAG: hydrogenase maturation protease [Candidatus Altiarchaeota archaeon]